MKLVIGTEPVMLPYKGHVTPMLQNLGPGIVYFDADPDVAPDTGIQMQVNTVYEFPRDLSNGGGGIWLVADTADCDVRIIRVG